MGSIEKRGENTWRVGFRRSVADGRGWVRKPLSFPADMPEVEQRKACEVELARLAAIEIPGCLIAPVAALASSVHKDPKMIKKYNK